jgi:hypothetical protein
VTWECEAQDLGLELFFASHFSGPGIDGWGMVGEGRLPGTPTSAPVQTLFRTLVAQWEE